MTRSAIVTRKIDPATLMAEVQSSEFGATSLFTGTVRDTNHGRAVTAIEYSAYTSMAEAELDRILAEALDRFGVVALVVEHRVGALALGDVSVAIVAAHAHRAPALECTRFVIDEIKKRVPIWKLEHYVDGAREWVDPTASSQVASVDPTASSEVESR
jgi:molybdopterin synthase catalytic subunit